MSRFVLPSREILTKRQEITAGAIVMKTFTLVNENLVHRVRSRLAFTIARACRR